jgi:hypothetical protein
MRLLKFPGTGPEAVSLAGNTASFGNSSAFTNKVSGERGAASNPQATFDALPDSNRDSGLLTLSEGALNAKIALLGHHIASSFALSAAGNGGTIVAEMGQIANPTLLANPLKI